MGSCFRAPHFIEISSFNPAGRLSLFSILKFQIQSGIQGVSEDKQLIPE